MALPRILALSLGIAGIPLAQCCMGLGSPFVTFNGQMNIIIWDPETKTEHFIRDAKFDGNVENLGFIAPTPTEPDLGAVKGAAFDVLDALDPRPRGRGGFGGGFGGGGGGFVGGGEVKVQVIAEKDIEGYHATVLKATDASALMTWLKVNAYKVTESQQDWLDFYVKKEWYFTAFKVSKDNQVATRRATDPLRTGAVRISFKTDEPFNPHYVPLDNIPKSYRSSDQLSLLFVAPGRYDATIGHAAEWESTKLWATALPIKERSLLAQHIGEDVKSIPQNSTVTCYVDTKFPRNVWDDLYFSRIPEKPATKRDGSKIGFVVLGVLPFALLLRRRI